MSASGDGDSDGECPSFDSDTTCDIILGSSRAVAIISMSSSVYIVIAIIALKRYKYLPQRLILYLNISMVFYTFQYVWGDYRITNDGFCKFQGWYDILTAWIAFLWLCIITFNIGLTTVLIKRLGRKYDLVYWTVAVIPAIIISFIPFAVDAYGPAGIWCWISSEKDDETFAAGIAMQFALFYGPWLLLCVVMAVVLIAVYCRVKYKLWMASHSMEGSTDSGPGETDLKQTWEEQVKPLMPFPVIFIAILIFPIFNRLRLPAGYETDSGSAIHFILWFLLAVSLPLPGFLFALAFTFNKKTLKDLKDVLSKSCKKRDKVEEANGVRMSDLKAKADLDTL